MVFTESFKSFVLFIPEISILKKRMRNVRKFMSVQENSKNKKKFSFTFI